jgi:hypothetical protein
MKNKLCYSDYLYRTHVNLTNDVLNSTNDRLNLTNEVLNPTNEPSNLTNDRLNLTNEPSKTTNEPLISKVHLLKKGGRF